jgi:tRNA (cytidine/uridine-2'-O-)-methyltransferase
MFHVVLFEPEIPPNTGNIMRLCVNAGCHLHLIKPLGFTLDDKQLRRAGLDYREFAEVSEHGTLDSLTRQINTDRMFAITTKGSTAYTEAVFEKGDVFLFGPETRGLPLSLLGGMSHDRKLRIPMRANSRSLNLANAAAIIVYEAWRQVNFTGAS